MVYSNIPRNFARLSLVVEIRRAEVVCFDRILFGWNERSSFLGSEHPLKACRFWRIHNKKIGICAQEIVLPEFPGTVQDPFWFLR